RRDGVEVYEGVDGFEHTQAAGITVVAAGRMTGLEKRALPRMLTPWYASPSTPYFGIQALFKNVDGITDQVELDLVSNGYVGLARQSGGVNVCALTSRDALQRWGPNLDDILRQWSMENSVLAGHLRQAARIGPWMAVGPVRLGIRQLARDRTFY